MGYARTLKDRDGKPSILKNANPATFTVPEDGCSVFGYDL